MKDSSKVALVTGGAKRIGAGIVTRFHQAGYRVLIHCHGSREAAAELADTLNHARPGSAAVAIQDLADSTQLDNLVNLAIETFGRLDCLVNNASIFYPTPVDQLGTQHIDQIMDVNLKAPLLLSKAAARVMKRGAIVNIVDIYGERPLKNYLLYSISKAALQMLTRGLAIELAPDIRVNGVSPGAILWPADAAEMNEQEKAARLSELPMGKLGQPGDIAGATLFLADQSDYVTGQILAVDGGQSVA